MSNRRLSFEKSVQKVYTLDESALDEIVLSVQNHAASLGIEKPLTIRYGFLIDNALDSWLQHGARGREVKITFGRRLFVPYVSIEMAGEKLDPYPIHTLDFGIGGNDIAVFACQLPGFEYHDGTNYLILDLRREKKMIRQICIVASLAILTGILGNLLMTGELREELLASVVDPVIDMFFNLLRCISGPMIFLSVVWGICGIGDSRIFGRVGKAVLLYSFGITALGAVIGAFSFPFIGNGFSAVSSESGTLASLLEMILGIVPNSVVEPFSTGNTMQIIFLAMAMGLALITISGKVGQLVIAVDQFNNVVQHLMGTISSLVPYIVFLLITEMIWTGSLSLVFSMWKFFAVMISALLVIALLLCTVTSVKRRVRFSTVAKKNLSTLLVSLTTASSAAAFGNNITAATKGYGIADEMANFSIPLGMIMHNPVAACYNILLVVYFAAVYGVSCSFGWLVTAVVVSAIVAISTPPIPGGAAIGYALLLSQLGVPEEALAVVLVLDVITDFIVTAFECYVLPISLANIAGKMGELNVDILRK